MTAPRVAAVALAVAVGVVGPAAAQAPASVVREGAAEWTAAVGHGWGVGVLHSRGEERYLLPMVSWGRVLSGPRGPSWLRGRFEWAIEVVPLFAQYEPETARGGALSPLVWRWNFAPRGRVAPFAEVGGGAVWTTAPIPAGTTRSNLTVHMTGGVRLFGDGRDALVVAYRLDHISNGNRLVRNPGVNAHMIVVGWSHVRP